MYWDSNFWNYGSGMCEKHNLPALPCPACLSELSTAKGDNEMILVIDELECTLGRTPADMPGFDPACHQVQIITSEGLEL